LLELVCKCGHTKQQHEYQRDSHDKTGQCMVIDKLTKTRIKTCYCKMYETKGADGQ
jgi:hypothetical protein